MNFYLWFLLITTILFLGSIIFIEFYGEFDEDMEAFLTLVFIVLQIMFFFVYAYAMAIIWIILCVNTQQLNKVDFVIIVGLIEIFGSVFGGTKVYNS